MIQLSDHHEIFITAQLFIHTGKLPGKTDQLSNGFSLGSDRMTAYGNFTAIKGRKCCQYLNRRCLSGTIGTKQTIDRAFSISIFTSFNTSV